jgi:UTP--glucose-1-phosphate uridylyltransferase
MIRKAVIPAAGLGIRFLPATKSVPKEMLPIIDKPIIQYVLEEATASGIDDILIVTGRGKRAIEDYFDASPELEDSLAGADKADLLKEVRDISSLADIHYVRQKEPRGLGAAVLRAEKHVGNEPFAVLLGDDIIKGETPCLRQLMDIYERCENPGAVIGVEQVEDVTKYGIIKGDKIDKSVYRVEDIIEKPSFAEAPSNIGAVGRYILSPEIFSYIKETPSGKGSEIQLTDAIRMLIKAGGQNVYAVSFTGKRYDAGDKLGHIKAIMDFALDRDDLRDDIKDYLRLKHLTKLR